MIHPCPSTDQIQTAHGGRVLVTPIFKPNIHTESKVKREHISQENPLINMLGATRSCRKVMLKHVNILAGAKFITEAYLHDSVLIFLNLFKQDAAGMFDDHTKRLAIQNGREDLSA